MKVEGSIRPEEIYIQYIEKGIAHIRLRKNITEVEKIHEQTEEPYIMFEYDEVEFEIVNKFGLMEYLQSNFDSLWTYGEGWMVQRDLKEERKAQLYNLVDKVELPEALEIIAGALVDRSLDCLMLGQQVADLELRLMMLEAK